MKYWRMSMRWGSDGRDFVEECFKRGIAAIGYYDDDWRPIVGDCMKLARDKFEAIWHAKAPERSSPRASLRNFAYEMSPGDIIYARSSPYIVAKGVVTSEYRFDPEILKDAGCIWEHYVTVDWERLAKFKVRIEPSIPTLIELKDTNLEKMQAAEDAALQSSLAAVATPRTWTRRRTGDAAEAFAARGGGPVVQSPAPEGRITAQPDTERTVTVAALYYGPSRGMTEAKDLLAGVMTCITAEGRRAYEMAWADATPDEVRKQIILAMDYLWILLDKGLHETWEKLAEATRARVGEMALKEPVDDLQALAAEALRRHTRGRWDPT